MQSEKEEKTKTGTQNVKVVIPSEIRAFRTASEYLGLALTGNATSFLGVYGGL